MMILSFKMMIFVFKMMAGSSGYTLGVGAARPFDVNTSASFTLSPAQPSGHATSGGSLSFWLSSTFATYDLHGLALDPVWRGKLFVRAVLQLPTETNVTLLDLDVFALTGCSKEVGSSAVVACIAQEMLQVNVSVPAISSAGWRALTIELYARDAVNLNYYNSKLATLWEVSLQLDGAAIPISPATFRTEESAARFQPHGAPANASVSNVGHVQAHDNSNFSIAPACDGLLFPFAENGGMAYSPTNYKSLLGLAQTATQGRGQHLW